MVSALSSYGVNELFETIGKTLLGKNRKESTSNITVKTVQSISLKTEDIKEKKKGGGCCK